MDAEMSDIDATNTAPITQKQKASSMPRLSEDEKQVLGLWDHIQHLRMGIAALRAERDLVPHQNPTEDDLEKARDDSLEAGALYALHSAVTDAVLVASPVLQAIHGGEKAHPIESDLLPILEKRDEVSLSLARQTKSLEQTMMELSKTEREVLLVMRKNLDLSETLLGLVNEIEQTTREKVGDIEGSGEVKQLRREMAEVKKRWMFMKATASAIVAGSGVDWARNPELRDVVLDPEDE